MAIYNLFSKSESSQNGLGRTREGLVSKVLNSLRGPLLGAAVAYNCLNPSVADAGVTLWGSAKTPYGVQLDHIEGATDGYDLLLDSVWSSLPPDSPSQWVQPFTTLEGRDLDVDNRSIHGPYTPFEVQLRAKDALGTGFDLNNFGIIFRDYQPREGITDWNYEWSVPGIFTSSGEDFYAKGKFSDLTWFTGSDGLNWSSIPVPANISGLKDGDIFSRITLTPVPEPSAGALLITGIAAALSRRRRK